MKQPFILSFLLLVSVNIIGQTQNVDSLINVLEARKQSDKEQIKIYKKICYAYLRSDMDKLISYAEKGLKLAQKNDDKVYTSGFFQFLGTGYYTKGNYDTALNYFEKALDLSIKTKDERLEATIYGSIANIYTFWDKETTAMEYLLKALSIFERLGDKKYIAVTLCNISNIHEILQNEQQAILSGFLIANKKF